ncbi:glycosyltransferase [Tenacibaculum halocynthiae]|uniref:glycosyltransferase n=1 Tax=Tenacibaculum halocynthiae TaxID=1254437 RepID=UPI0038945D7E
MNTNNKMGKILMVLPNDSLGGAEQVLKMIADYKVKENEIYIYFLKKQTTKSWEFLKEKNKDKVKISYSKFNLEFISLLFLPLRLMFKNFDYAYTSHVLITGLLGLLKKTRLVKIKHFIGRESTTVFNRFSGMKLNVYKLMYYLGYRELDLLICQTDNMLNEFEKNLPSVFSKIRVKTIANPVDLAIIKQKEKETIEINKDFYMVSAGRLINEKGFDILIKAFKIIKEEFINLNLIILGEGKERVNLENLIKQNKLEDSIKLKGFVQNVYPYFNKASTCVVSSRVEGFPNVLLQMISQNNRVVSTLCAGGIKDLKGIYMADTNNHVMLANVIKKSLRDNTDKNRELFDNELKNRSIEFFLEKIEFLLNEKIS